MLRRFSVNAAIAAMTIDILLVVAGMALTTILVEYHLLYPWRGIPRFDLLTYIVFPFTWWAIFLGGALYDGRRNLRLVNELTSFFSFGLLATVALSGITYLFRLETPRAEFFAFIILTAFMQLLARISMRALWHLNSKYNNDNGSRRVLIIGAGEMGRRVKAELQKYESETAIQFVGFLDDNPQKRALLQVIGNLMDLLQVVKEKHVSDVVITLPASAHEVRAKLVDTLISLSVHVWVIPDVFRLALYQSTLETFAGMPMMDLRAPAINEHQRLAKRIFDLAATSILLFFVWPVMLVIAILIGHDSPGPIIFRQKRIGENGQPFEMYKFRTMVQNAEQMLHLVEQRDEQGNILHKSPSDPRVTRIGRFLRRTSLDELPQLFNVFKGDMSLVGPRPELPHLVERYQSWQHARFSVPPGMTGWWQINGRSDKPMHLNTADDIYYVQNCSILFDIQILLKTVIVVILNKGAY